MRLLFLTGHRKGGTTLLHKLFDSHPDLCIYPVDIGLLYAYFPGFVARHRDDRAALLERIILVVRKNLSHVTAAGGEIDIDELISILKERLLDADLCSKKQVLTALLESWRQYAKAGADAVMVVKETTQSIYIEEWLQMFDDCKIISIIRDPRDNYAAIKAGVVKHYSLLGEGDLESLASVINRARMDMLSADLNQGAYADVFRYVRFEDLVTNAESEMRKLADFAGISFGKSLLEPTVLGVAFHGNSHEDKKFDGISASNKDRWRERISEEEAQVIEFWLADVMPKFGYMPAFDRAVSQQAFAKFYDWYNQKYFYGDAFARAAEPRNV